MGAHRNYDRIILTLAIFKENLIGSSPLIARLKKMKPSFWDEDYELPTNKNLSEELGIPRVKINKELKDLYDLFINEHWNNPPEIKNVFHTIIIQIPYDEIESGNTKRGGPRFDEDATFFRLKLSETPRIGEQISLDFLDGDTHSRGYVNEIRHNIYGDVHEISIYVHPFKNYCHQWDKMKKENERWERRMKAIMAMG